jgi:uncharacterized protein YecE (DUF72 family)
LCRELDLTHVVDPFVSQTATPEFAYVRLHGTTGARHVYTDEELRWLAAWLPEECERPYVLFNNLPRVPDARRFRALLEGGGAAQPRTDPRPVAVRSSTHASTDG